MTERVLSRCWSAEAQRNAALDLVAYTSWCAQDHPHWRKQHPARIWEYAQALRVMIDLPARARLLLDVGGAGSPLPWIVASRQRQPMQIVDPEFNGIVLGDTSHYPAAAVHKAAVLSPLRGRADFISCISVIEHVEDEEAFLRDLVELLAPGGVLFLTTDYVEDAPDGDVFQFRWMRKRIYTRASWFGEVPADRAEEVRELRLHESVRVRVCNLGCEIFGGYDTAYHGPIPDLGYSFASLCVRKEG